MAVNKVIYGTSVLVDLTADTVDAAHLAKGYTAHDAAGNAVVGTLESQTDSNLLHGLTPTLLNGATKSGNAYLIPASSTGKEFVRYKLDLPKLTSGTLYRLSASGQTGESGQYGSFYAYLYFRNQDGSTAFNTGVIFVSDEPSSQCCDIELASGAKPTAMVFSSLGTDNKSMSIYNITLNAFEK